MSSHVQSGSRIIASLDRYSSSSYSFSVAGGIQMVENYSYQYSQNRYHLLWLCVTRYHSSIGFKFLLSSFLISHMAPCGIRSTELSSKTGSRHISLASVRYLLPFLNMILYATVGPGSSSSSMSERVILSVE